VLAQTRPDMSPRHRGIVRHLFLFRVGPVVLSGYGVALGGPRGVAPPPNLVTIGPGMRMSDVERAVIEPALRETRGNRRRAAEMLGIGERTLYRKIKEYRLPETLVSANVGQ
jgi:transcriptional regulator of acetoin/glycerol metabolism